MIRSFLAVTALQVFLAVGASGLGTASSAAETSSAPQSIATVAVRIDNFTFTPAEITVAPGTTVTWTNGDDIPHTVVASDHGFRSPVLDTDGVFSFTFTTIGTFEYFCSLHPHMKGIVRVVAS